MARLSSTARAASGDDELELDYSERAGYLTGKAAAIADWQHRKEKAAFEKVVAVLRARRWYKNNPERARENNRKADQRKYAKRRDKRAWLVRGHVLACARCGTEWCRIPLRYMGPEPKYCPNGCLKKAMHERAMARPDRRAAAVARAVAWQKANAEKHRQHTREYARRKRASESNSTDGGGERA